MDEAKSPSLWHPLCDDLQRLRATANLQFLANHFCSKHCSLAQTKQTPMDTSCNAGMACFASWLHPTIKSFLYVHTKYHTFANL